jgi:glycosyltransferase involved in cell wall biosynthesis
MVFLMNLNFLMVRVFLNHVGNTLIDKNLTEAIKLKFIGVEFYPEQQKRIVKAFSNIPVKVETTPRLSHEKALREMNNSDVFLLPANPDFPQVYAKVFDYLALRKPILLFKSDRGTLSTIIKATNAGYACNTPEEIKNIIQKMLLEWQKTGEVSCQSKNIEQYSRKEQTRRLAQLLDQMG